MAWTTKNNTDNFKFRVNFISDIYAPAHSFTDRHFIIKCIKTKTRRVKNLTFDYFDDYNCRMKKIFTIFIVLGILIISGCGVKSDLKRPDPSFPRNYPIY